MLERRDFIILFTKQKICVLHLLCCLNQYLLCFSSFTKSATLVPQIGGYYRETTNRDKKTLQEILKVSYLLM